MLDFVEVYKEFYLTPRPAELREGQAAFNFVEEKFPDIANQLRGTDLDPFYVDSRLGGFWHEVQRLYYEQNS